MEEESNSLANNPEDSNLARKVDQTGLNDQITSIWRSGQDDLESQIFSYLDNIFPKVTEEQQKNFGITPYSQSENWYLVPQSMAKELMLCFIGSRIDIGENYGFVIAGRLLEEIKDSQHPFAIWSTHEQTEPLFKAEIKIPKEYGSIRPSLLYFGEMRRTELCLNKYNLYILRPKLPAPEGKREKEDIYLLGAIDIQDPLLNHEPFKTYIENFEEMRNHNKQVKDPKFLYSSEDCTRIREEIFNSNSLRVRNNTFPDNFSSNNRRNVAEKIILLPKKIEEKNSSNWQNPVLNHQSGRNEREEQPRSVDENGNHFLFGNIRAQNPDNSIQNSLPHEPSAYSSHVTSQNLASTASPGN